MQDKQLFEYAVIRVVPRVEREEFLNVGVILYCAGGVRSLFAAQTLEQMGYTNVASMSGGFQAWKGAGLAAVDDPGVAVHRVDTP